jgi:hypothetical protein
MRVLFCFLLLLPALAFSQRKSLKLNATFSKVEGQSKTHIATVEIEKNGVIISKEVVQGGKYRVTLDTGAVYKVYFSKVNHVSKFLVIDTHNIPKNAKKRQILRVEMSFFLAFEDLDFSFLKTSPISIARYDELYRKIKWDKDYTKMMNEKIAQILINL